METPHLPARRLRGRPKAGTNLLRGQLLMAAKHLLATTGTDNLVLRQIAEQATVTPALAHYYFDDRDGLVDALLHEQAEPQIDALLTTITANASNPAAALILFVQRITTLIIENPWLVPCLALAAPAAHRISTRLRISLLQLTSNAQAKQQLRADLSPEYISQALLALCLHRFTGDQATAAQLTLQHIALLRDGLVAQPHRPGNAGIPHRPRQVSTP